MSPTCWPDMVMSAIFSRKGMSWRHTTRKNRPRHTVFVCLFADTIHNPPAHHIMPPKRKKKGLAPHVADMSPTRVNVAKSWPTLRVVATQKSPRHTQFISITTDKYKPAQTYGYLSYLENLCLSSNNNHEITYMSGTADMSCRFGHPGRHDIFLCRRHDRNVSRHVADTTQNVAVWAKKRHADIRHMELRHCLIVDLCLVSHQCWCMH